MKKGILVLALIVSLVLIGFNVFAASGDLIVKGNLGVVTGTTPPAQKLDVQGNAIVSGKLGIGTTNPTDKLTIVGIPGVDGIRFPDNTFQITAASGTGGTNKQIFTSPLNTPLTWTNPGVTNVKVTVCGGGGGGSYKTTGTSTAKPGGGGGGAGQCIVSDINVNGNATFQIGNGGQKGLPGSTSYFTGSTLTIYAQGGQPGVTAASGTSPKAGGAGGALGASMLAGGAGISGTPYANPGIGTAIGGSGGAGGAGTSSTTANYGGAGGGGGLTGSVPATTTGGAGGAALFMAGKGGKGGNSSGAHSGGGGGGSGYGYGSNGGDGATGTTAGTAGSGYASGGGGGNFNADGGAGAPGIVIVEWMQ